MLYATLAVLVVASLATNRLPRHWYVPVGIAGTAALLGCGVAGGLDAATLGLGWAAVPSGLLWGTGVIVLVGGLYAIGIHIPRLEPLFGDQRVQSKTGPQIVVKTTVEIPFGTVLLEEVAFRGVLYGLLTQAAPAGWGPDAFAITVSSALFGLWHILPALQMHDAHELAGSLGSGTGARVGAVLGTVITTGLAGVLFGLLRWHTGSLIAPMCLHWATNSLGSLAAWWVGRRS